jgi:cysteine desulfurase
MIYLDNNATTRVADEVLAAMEPYYRTFYGNPHSTHRLGRRAHDGIEEARGHVAQSLGVNAGEVVFTSCGTEGNAIVLRGLLGSSTRKKIVATTVEHPSVLTLLRALEKTGEITLTLVGVDSDGVLDLEAMREAIDHDTLLVTVMLAQNETGVIHPIGQIAAMAHARGALVHVDAVQAAGKIAIDRDTLGADFLAISGHKLHAPKGVGALAIRQGIRLAPIWYGGGQEHGLRSGTEPVPSIVAFGEASRWMGEFLPQYGVVAALRDEFESALKARLSDVSINGAGQLRLGNTSNVSFHHRYADELVRALDARDICASTGAACDSGKVEPSATMKAMGKPLDVAMGAVRFSLSRYTTADEIGRAVEGVCGAVGEVELH